MFVVRGRFLTCARCLRDAAQGPNLTKLERGLDLMTAVRGHLDHIRRKDHRWQDPESATITVHAWGYSSGHCRISQQVSLRRTDYRALIPDCGRALIWRGTEAATMSLNITDIHIIHWGGRARWFGGERCGLEPVCPTFNTLQWSAVCVPVSKAHSPLPFCSLQQQCVPRIKLSAQQYPHLTPSNSNWFKACFRNKLEINKSLPEYLNSTCVFSFFFFQSFFPQRSVDVLQVEQNVSRAFNGSFILSTVYKNVCQNVKIFDVQCLLPCCQYICEINLVVENKPWPY